MPAARAVSAEPNVTPMIDVLLVLLVIFMLIVPEVRRTIDAPLARPSGDGPSPRTVFVEAAPGGRYALQDGGAPDDAALTAAALRARLDVVRRTVPGTVVLVRGAPEASYQDVMSALDLSRGAGLTRVGLAPKPPAPPHR